MQISLRMEWTIEVLRCKEGGRPGGASLHWMSEVSLTRVRPFQTSLLYRQKKTRVCDAMYIQGINLPPSNGAEKHATSARKLIYSLYWGAQKGFFWAVWGCLQILPRWQKGRLRSGWLKEKTVSWQWHIVKWDNLKILCIGDSWNDFESRTL